MSVSKQFTMLVSQKLYEKVVFLQIFICRYIFKKIIYYEIRCFYSRFALFAYIYYLLCAYVYLMTLLYNSKLLLTMCTS